MMFKLSGRVITVDLRGAQKSHGKKTIARVAPTMQSAANELFRAPNSRVERETAPSEAIQNLPPHSDASGYSEWLRQTFPAIVRSWSIRLWPMRFRVCVDVRQEQNPVVLLQQLMCCSRTHASHLLEEAEVDPSERSKLSKQISTLRAIHSSPDSAKANPEASSLKPSANNQ